MIVALSDGDKRCYNKIFFAYFDLFYDSKILQKFMGRCQDTPLGLVPVKEVNLTRNYFAQFALANFSIN